MAVHVFLNDYLIEIQVVMFRMIRWISLLLSCSSDIQSNFYRWCNHWKGSCYQYEGCLGICPFCSIKEWRKFQETPLKNHLIFEGQPCAKKTKDNILFSALRFCLEGLVRFGSWLHFSECFLFDKREELLKTKPFQQLQLKSLLKTNLFLQELLLLLGNFSKKMFHLFVRRAFKDYSSQSCSHSLKFTRSKLLFLLKDSSFILNKLFDDPKREIALDWLVFLFINFCFRDSTNNTTGRIVLALL